MKNILIQGCINDFKEQFGYESETESKLFELLVNYCIVSRYASSPFETEDITVGGSGEFGIDGIAIMINDIVVTDLEDLKSIFESSKSVEIKYIFTQSKTSNGIESGDVLKFSTAVKCFFDSENIFNKNDKINELYLMSKYILSNISKIASQPICEAYFAFAGKLHKDDIINAITDKWQNEMVGTNFFSNVRFEFVDESKILSAYRELNNRIERDVDFEKNTALPSIRNIKQAFIGAMLCSEYIKLITDNEGNLKRSLFYDNVRDFQGMNNINKEISGTLIKNNQDRFSILNNGVTIVAKELLQMGPRFKLSDYQIVNGCQTSHILYINRDKINSNTYLPVKLIVTDNYEITGQIIKATNRQTNVNIEAFEAIRDFHKRLELLYDTMRKEHPRRLYYERRSKQYDNTEVKRYQIITIPLQINSFISMFLHDPHSTHRYYGELLRSYDGKIFNDSDHLLPYYVSAYALNTIEELFKTNALNAELRYMKYHMLMLFKIIITGNSIPHFNSKEFNANAASIMKVVSDISLALKCFTRAQEYIKEIIKKHNVGYQTNRVKVITTELLKIAKCEC